MRQTFACSATLMTLLVALLASPSASAQTVVINYSFRGLFSETGERQDGYFVGDIRKPPCVYCYADTRNFFVFDLLNVAKPIASAKLALSEQNASPTFLGFQSPDPSENYELHDIVDLDFVGPPPQCCGGFGFGLETPNTVDGVATLSTVDGVAIHADLGSGVVYGSRIMTAADNGTVVEIELNSSAIAAMNATNRYFGIGGSITTLDSLPNYEFAFGFGGTVTQLRLTLVPEPSTFVLCKAAIFTSQLRRNRRR